MRMKVLDHGYVEFVEAWGHGKELTVHDTGFIDNEIGIIESARQSTQGNFRGWGKDQTLLEYLYLSKPKHAGPFEFAGMTIEVQAPIFVFREWHRHRTQSYNEMSARYAPLPDNYYEPNFDNVMERAHTITKNKQAQGIDGIFLTEENSKTWLELLDTVYNRAELFYDFGLKIGIPKELARIGMPVGHYSRMRATGNLRNWLAFLTLRMDPAAQWEIQQFANAVGSIIHQKFPRTWKLFRLETSKK